MKLKSFILMLNEEIKNQWNIPPKIINNYQNITKNINDYSSKWQGKIILGNSLSDKKKKGHWDQLDYVAIAINDKWIIPVARGDEHRTGWELIHHYIKKKLIPQAEYEMICPFSNTYLYDDSDETQKRLAIKKWIGYGGNPKSKVVRVQKTSFGSEAAGTFEDLISKQLDVQFDTEKKLSPLGQKFINSLEELAKLNIDRLTGDTMKVRRSEKNMFAKAKQLCETTKTICRMALLDIKFEEYLSKVKTAEIYSNYQLLEDVIFGMKGIKNSFHQWVRKSKKNPWAKEEVIKTLGNPEKALQELDRIGNLR